MNRVINTINSTWGTYYTPVAKQQPDTCVTDLRRHLRRLASVDQGTIKMATWSFNHAGVRGRTDQCREARRAACRSSPPGVSAPRAYGVHGAGLHQPWYRAARDFLRRLRRETPAATAGSAAAPAAASGGAPHSKYFLFTDVGQQPTSRQHRGADVDEPDALRRRRGSGTRPR